MPRTTKKTTATIEKHTIPTVPAAEQPYQVPKNWRWVRLSQIIDVQKEKTENFSDESIRYIGLENMEKDEGIVSYGCASDIKSLKNVFKEGNILYGKLRPYLNKHDIAPFDGICSTDILVFDTKNNTINNYVNHYFDLQYFIEYAVSNSKGINLPRVSADIIMNATIPLPPLAEQQRIVDCIERLFAKLDEAREKAQAVVDGFENRKAAILHQAFTGELTKKWREERGIGMESWKRIPLAELCERIFDGPFGSNLKTEDYVDSGIRVVRLENIKNLWFDDSKQSFVTKEKYRTIENHTVYPTDLIMATFISDEIKICQMPSYIGYAINKSDCVGIRLKDIVRHQYVLFYLSSKDVYNNLLKNIHGATRPRVNTKQIKSIIIPTASLDEQTIIVQEIDKLFSQERRARELAESVIAQIDGMKKAILARAFRGDLGTNDPSEAVCECISNNNH